MICPRCNQPMQERIRRHKDGSRDVTHTCKRHIMWQTLRERRDATDAQVVAMRREGMGGYGRFDPQARAATSDGTPVCGVPRKSSTMPVISIDIDYFMGREVGKHGPGTRLHRETDGRYTEADDRCNAPEKCHNCGEEWFALRASRAFNQECVAWECTNCQARAHRALAWKDSEPSVDPCTLATPAPKPPRPVKVGDVLLVHGLTDRRRVVREVNHGGAHYYPDPGNVDIGQFMLFRDMRDAGWTHADGAAIAEAAPERRTIGALDTLCNCNRERFCVESFDGERYTVQSLREPRGYRLCLDQLRANGWTFADTGEAV